ncbi:hypothetical protein KC336_g69 [Hortaea werneckii]|nr:hypothetical protein KC336_g69 [Hortaea werneckii]
MPTVRRILQPLLWKQSTLAISRYYFSRVTRGPPKTVGVTSSPKCEMIVRANAIEVESSSRLKQWLCASLSLAYIGNIGVFSPSRSIEQHSNETPGT